MHLYSYRGIAYTIAPSAIPSSHHSIQNSSVEHATEQPTQQNIFTHLPQTQTPTAVIPMLYRGALYLLERFHTPYPPSQEECMEACSDESIESSESAKSAKSADE